MNIQIKGFSGGKHTIQYTDDVLENCKPETYIILLANFISINSITNKDIYELYVRRDEVP